MKKILCGAILTFCLAACYTPLNNSGVATTKPWLEIPAKKLDFDGKQYDSCYQFNIRIWPQEAAEQIDLAQACISDCCWRSDKEEVTLDFNKNFEADLAFYGRARKYSPGKVTFRVAHSNLVNTTKVTVSPTGTVNNKGLLKLSYKEYENPARLAQIEAASRRLQTRRNAYLIEQQQRQAAQEQAKEAARQKAAQNAAARTLLLRRAGTQIDAYFYQMNKTYKKQGAIFLLSERILLADPLNTQGDYSVTCHAQARTGVDIQNLKASTFSCGTWRVSLEDGTVQAYDKKARQIMGE